MRRQGYLFRQLIWLTAAVAIPLLALLGYNVHQDGLHARRAAFETVENRAASIAHDAETLLTATESYLNFMADRPLVSALDERRCDPLLDGVTRRRQHFANVIVTNEKGQPICAALKNAGGALPAFTDAGWFQQAAHSDTLVLSRPFPDPVHQRMVSAASVALRDASHRRTGTLTVLIDLESIEAAWSRYALPTNSRLTLLDRHGTIMVTRPDFHARVGTSASAVLQKAVAANPGGIGIAPGIDGVDRAFALKPIQAGGWQAVAAIPTADVFAEYHAQIRASIAWATTLMLAVLLVAVAMARRMAAPLTALADTARAVAHGDATIRAAESAPGEFGLVATEFNTMLDARHRADASLMESERRYADMLANVEMISLMLDATGHVTYCNDHLLSLSGHARSDLIGANWWTEFVPSGHQNAGESFLATMRGGAFQRHTEYEIMLRPAGRRLVQWHHSMLHSANGETVGLASLGVDITETRLSQVRERRHADFYTALSRTNSAIVRMSDPQALYQEICGICVEHGHASIAYVSLVEGERVRPVAWAGPAESFLRDFAVSLDPDLPGGRGLTADAIRTGLHQVANHCIEDPRTMPWRARALEIGTQAVSTFPFRRAGKTTGALSLHMTVDGFFDDRLIALLEEMTGDMSFALDNFDRDLARAAAERQAQLDAHRFLTLFQNAPAAMSIVSVEDNRLLDVNETYESFTHQTRQQLIGRNAFEPGLWPGPEERIAFFKELELNGRVRNFEMRGALTRRDYLLQADLLEFADRPCVLTIANDVTEIRQANQARHALLGAESASQAKTEFLSRMSHELRTPLNAVLGFAQLLQSDPNHPLSAHHQTQVEHIRRAGWHLLTLINDVLDVAKIEAGKTEVEERGVALVDLLDEVMLLNEPAAIEHSVGMTALYRRDARIGVLADPRRLRQVMINLLSNAIKYNRPGGRVTLDIVLRSGQTHIHVEDTGLGMTPEQLAHLYEPFNRLGRERITVEGSGLGLALTRQLVHLMRGQIEITSDAGVGTRVTVSLQTHDAAESLDGSADATPTLSAEASDEDPTGVVLYIEDNPVNLLLVEQFLSRWPRVLLVQAENGTDGIALARTTKPDVILLDMRLPDMEGTDVLAALENFPLTPCRVIALSASAMPEDVKAARLAGAFDYWTKPLNFEQFRVEMARLLHTKP